MANDSKEKSILDKITAKLPSVLLGIIVISLFFLSVYFRYIPVYLFKLDVKNLSDATNGILALFSNVILAIILFFIYRKNLITYFKDFKKNFLEFIDTGFKYWIMGLMVMAISNIIINLLSPNNIANNEAAVQSMIKAVPLIGLISAGFLAPFIEEITFRKTFKDIFSNKWLFILSSGLLFGGLHVFLDVNNIFDLLYIIPYSALGISFAALYYKTNNLLVPMFFHALHNTIIVIMSIIPLFF